MKGYKYIFRKFDSVFIVWIEELNQWIQFEEAAFFVFEKLMQGLREGEIKAGFLLKFGYAEKESIRFIREIRASIRELGGRKSTVDRRPSTADHTKAPNDSIIHYYEANSRTIKIIYHSELTEYYIHHSFAHLESMKPKETDYLFEVSEKQLSLMQPIKKTWEVNDIPTLKRRVFIEFGNAIHGKTDMDWMTIIHGSAITDGKNTLLFCGPTGSGKSTLTSLLLKEGYRLVSDDYIPVEAATGRCFPFPAALSVKEGSFPLVSKIYPQLKEIPSKEFRLTNKSLRFLAPQSISEFEYQALNITHIFFMHFKPGENVKIDSINIPDAFKLFNEEAWISDKPEYAQKCIDWFASLQIYRLNYGDNVEVVKRIKEI